MTGHANGTVSKYIKGVSVRPAFKKILREKQGGSVFRSKEKWRIAKEEAGARLQLPLTSKERLLILTCLYWGEGTKRELNIINSDSDLLRIFISCLKDIGVEYSDLKISLRLYDRRNKEDALRHWSKSLAVEKSQIKSIEFLQGDKIGKLPYGMCRIRVAKGGKHFKLIMSMIDLLKSKVT